MNYDEEKSSLVKWFVIFAGLLLIVFTVFDLLELFPVVSDGLKLAGVVFCFLFSVKMAFSKGMDSDHVLLMFSLLFTVAADALLIFTPWRFWGVVVFCVVQELHSVRIFSIKRSIIRMDGRISASYRNYKVLNCVLLLNFFQLLVGAVPFTLSFFMEVPQVELLSVCEFYIIGFFVNLIQLAAVSRDVRLLDDMRPLRLYFIGMVLYFLCDIILGVFRAAEYFSVFAPLGDYISYAMIAIWALYLAGLVCIALSGNRSQEFYS